MLIIICLHREPWSGLKKRIGIPVLREYLAVEFQECTHVPFKEVSFERLIDDVVLLCFFVGTYTYCAVLNLQCNCFIS